MSGSVHLIGAEEVRAAGHRIATAAYEMSRAAASMDATLTLFLQRFEDLVVRIEAAAARVGGES